MKFRQVDVGTVEFLKSFVDWLGWLAGLYHEHCLPEAKLKAKDLLRLKKEMFEKLERREFAAVNELLLELFDRTNLNGPSEQQLALSFNQRREVGIQFIYLTCLAARLSRFMSESPEMTLRFEQGDMTAVMMALSARFSALHRTFAEESLPSASGTVLCAGTAALALAAAAASEDTPKCVEVLAEVVDILQQDRVNPTMFAQDLLFDVNGFCKAFGEFASFLERFSGSLVTLDMAS